MTDADLLELQCSLETGSLAGQLQFPAHDAGSLLSTLHLGPTPLRTRAAWRAALAR